MLDTVGPLARTVADLAYLDSALTGQLQLPEHSLRGVRIGVCPRDEPERQARLIRALEGAGAHIVEADVEGLSEVEDLIPRVIAGESQTLRLAAAARAVETHFADFALDAILRPATLLSEVPKVGDVSSGRRAFAHNVSIATLAGLPSLALADQALLDAPAGADRRLLALGVAIERVLAEG